MSQASVNELRLIEAADGIELTQADLSDVTQALNSWLSSLARALNQHQLQRPTSLRGGHALLTRIESINALVTESAGDWKRQWTALAPAQRLSQAFDDKVMLLVFGKFNAGKSSLCNLLAGRFAAHGRSVAYFHLEDGRVVWTAQALDEGATETTARVQGVSLGQRLVLLDTPGLHSVTPENAELTQNFTDSADAVLWLTSSTSPGQVQELGELSRELHRHKPLLPVITRSDVIEEDEVDGEIVKLLRSKTPANRRLQEGDVHLRAQEKLRQMDVATSLLKPPVSVSAHVAREQGETEEALAQGGFTDFYAALVDLVEPALAYKQRKPAEVLLHHLEENVLGALGSRLLPELSQLLGQLLQERERLQALQTRITTLVWRQVASEVPRLLEQHESALDVRGLCGALQALLQESLANELASQLGDYEVEALGVEDDLAIELPPGSGYVVVDASPDLPAVDGSPPSQATKVVSHEHLHDALQKAVHLQLTHCLETVFTRYGKALDGIENSTHALQALVSHHRDTLQEIKASLRAASV
ncbi:dynamin family protein [Ottowia thiooxydans]|uniref:GTPase SAR1 family protein n=1 Tax=Ottowia thiooxydans TaxID=219182 RepID=A0ABV2Q6L5_9BURK